MTKPHYRRTADGETRMVHDGLVNFTTGLAVVGQSKAAGGTYQFTPANPQSLAAAYRTSWLAKACVDMPVDDAIGPGRFWQATQDQINAIEAEERRLKWKASLRRAKKLARRDGGSAIFIDDGGDTTQEFDPERLQKGGIRKLIVFSKSELAHDIIERDIEAPGYGRPQEWRITSASRQLTVHPSRLVFYAGDAVLDEMALGAQSIWSDSVLESRLAAIRDADATIANTAELLYEANIDVIGIEGLMSMMKSGDEERVIQRIQLMRLGKSVSKILVRDKEEEYDRKAVNFGALPDLLREMLQVASGATQIPATRLLGRSPAGMNATGDGDERVYFDRLDALRDEVQEEGEVLDEALIRSALGGRPAGLHYTWPPLRQLSDKEKAEIGKMIAEKWESIGRAGHLTPQECRVGMSSELIEAGVAPGLEEAMEKTGEVDFGFGGEEDEDEEREGEGEGGAEIGDAEPRTLYVHRKVKNAGAIIAWAKAQGFRSTLPAEDMHVTIAFSRQRLDWMRVGESWQDEVKVAAGGPRLMERFGEARVLLFAASELSWRHEDIKRAGASWDHPDYQPHITISYAEDAPDLDEVEPYKGEIVLGPEVFEEVKEDWQEGIVEA